MNNNLHYCTASSFRYAQALIDLDIDADVLKKVHETLVSSHELVDVLANPLVSLEKKSNILKKLFESKEILGFLNLLIKNDDLNILDGIMSAYKTLLLKRDEQLSVKLYYVEPPSQSQLEHMEAFMLKKYPCKKVDWNLIKSDELIGGFILNANGTEYDYSIDGYLKGLRADLTRR